jgi:hypothetical protein
VWVGMVTIGTSEEASRSASANRAEAVARVLPSRPSIAVALLSATAASTLRRPPQPTEPVRRGSMQWQTASSGRVNIALGTDEAARGSAAPAERERDRTGCPCAEQAQRLSRIGGLAWCGVQGLAASHSGTVADCGLHATQSALSAPNTGARSDRTGTGQGRACRSRWQRSVVRRPAPSRVHWGCDLRAAAVYLAAAACHDSSRPSTSKARRP